MLEKTQVRRQMRNLYRKAVRAGLTDIGVRLRNEIARVLGPEETIVEDEPVLIGDAQSPKARKGSGLGRWGWMVLTSRRAIWATLPDSRWIEADLKDLDLVFSEESLDTYRWRSSGRRVTSVTIGFIKKSEIRSMLQDRSNDSRHTFDRD